MQSLEDITPDTTIAFAEAASSSDFFMPTHMLSEAGLVAGEGSQTFPFDESETRSLGESISMLIRMSALGNRQLSDTKRQALEVIWRGMET